MTAEARALYDTGMSSYSARAFAEAAQAFHAAYALDPRREILFAEAQATRLSGDCATAVPLYQAFLASAPPPQQIEATELALARCREVPTAPVRPAAGPARPADKQPPTPAPVLFPPARLAISAPATAPAAMWWRDRPGLSLAAVGVAGWAVTLGLTLAAAHADGDARAAVSYDGAQDRRHVAEGRARWAQRIALGAAAFTTAAAARFVWVGVARSTPVVGAAGRF
jgi:hypothetical protein